MRAVIRVPALHRYLRKAYEEEALRRGAPARQVETTIGETLPLECRASSLSGAARLNLMVPALSIRHVFGGISTALQLFQELVGTAQNARIILTDEQSFVLDDNPSMAGWEIVTLEDADRPGRLIVAAGNRYGRSLAVSARDHFMATAWWTANLTGGIRNWQAQHFQFPARRRFAYLIQDFEPGFYPWSSRYALADATYRQPQETVAIFNTSLLKDFFLAEGYHFDEALVLEPGLNAGLREELAKSTEAARERRVLVYGRPGVERNAFPIIVDGLRQWCAGNADNPWEFISVGEQHPPIQLSPGRALTSLGKLTIAQYGAEMRRASLGISLMVSPHPSYPPLEMAAFGMPVITNRYKRKDLARFSSRIISLDPLDGVHLAAAIGRVLDATPEAAPPADDASGFFLEYLNGGTDLGGLGREVARRLFG